MNPNQQTIINGVVVEDYEWIIYYQKLAKASKLLKQPETACVDLPCVVCANNEVIAKLLLEKYNTNILAPMPSVLQPLVMPLPPVELSPEAVEFVPEPEVISDDDIDFDSNIDHTPTLSIPLRFIFTQPSEPFVEPVGVEETKGDDESSVCSEIPDSQDNDSVCSELTEETPVKIVNKWEAKTVVKIINDRWKKSKKYYIAHLINAASGAGKSDKPVEVVWGWKATRASTDPIIGAVRIVKKNRNSVNIRYRHQHDGQTEKRCVRVRNSKDGFGDYICVGKGNRIYMRQREGGGGLEDE
tara:strand:+ start:874 stop:1770 length:897 start_codon:yes stop_codon:yes gene_type:complete